MGRRLTASLGNLVDASDLAVLRPITDVRGTPEYRLDAVQTLLKRSIARIAA